MWKKITEKKPPENLVVKIKSLNIWEGTGKINFGKWTMNVQKGKQKGLPTHWDYLHNNI